MSLQKRIFINKQIISDHKFHFILRKLGTDVDSLKKKNYRLKNSVI